MMKKTKAAILAAGAWLCGVLPAVANNAENFRQHDQWGFMMTLTAMGVVFSALLILFICFKWADKAFNIVMYNLFVRPYKAMRRKAAGQKQAAPAPGLTVTEQATGRPVDDGEVLAAIGMALFLAEDGMHDAEADVLTLAPQPATGWTGVGRNQKQYPIRKF